MRVLAGDIGGTNTRLLIAEVEGPSVRTLAEQNYASAEHAGLGAILEKFLSAPGSRRLLPAQAACLAVAGPVQRINGGERARITNLPWQVDSGALAAECGLARVRLINDFQAVGYGVEALGPGDVVTLQPGSPEPHGPRVMLGAGTGLGQAIGVWQGDHYEVLPTEGGHVDFAPTDELQDGLLRHLRDRHGRVSYERVLSGSGLVAIYEFLESRGGRPPSPAVARAMREGDAAAAISAAALRQADALAGEALGLFVRIYGAHAGDLALTVLATGGIYIAGGIAPKIVARLGEGQFLDALCSKGRMSALMRDIPVQVVMNESVGRIGAALAAARLAGDVR